MTTDIFSLTIYSGHYLLMPSARHRHNGTNDQSARPTLSGRRVTGSDSQSIRRENFLDWSVVVGSFAWDLRPCCDQRWARWKCVARWSLVFSRL